MLFQGVKKIWESERDIVWRDRLNQSTEKRKECVYLDLFGREISL